MESRPLRVRAECHLLLREARRRIVGAGLVPAQGDHEGRPYEPICPDSPECYAQMATFPTCTPKLVRVSVQGDNTAEDADALLSTLAELLTRTAWSNLDLAQSPLASLDLLAAQE